MALIATPPPELPRGSGEIVMTVRRGQRIALYDRPRGVLVLRHSWRTGSGTPRAYWVQRTRGDWAAVRDLDVRYGQVWVRMDGAVRLSRTRWKITVDRSARRLTLRHGKRVVRRVRVAVGAAGTATPLGSYHVTEKLAGAGEYGCCIIALSGVQPNVPTGWQGGNQLAIHGTDTPGLIGSATSTGCLRASDADLRALARHVRPGTPVRIVS